MRIRTSDEGYILQFYDENNPHIHVMDCDIFPDTEVKIRSRKQLLQLKSLIDEIIEKEDWKDD